MRKFFSGTLASSSVRRVPSRSWVAISTRSLESMIFRGSLARGSGKILARQLQQHLLEVLAAAAGAGRPGR